MKEKIETFLESAKPKYVHVIQVFFVIKQMLKGLLYKLTLTVILSSLQSYFGGQHSVGMSDFVYCLSVLILL